MAGLRGRGEASSRRLAGTAERISGPPSRADAVRVPDGPRGPWDAAAAAADNHRAGTGGANGHADLKAVAGPRVLDDVFP